MRDEIGQPQQSGQPAPSKTGGQHSIPTAEKAVSDDDPFADIVKESSNTPSAGLSGSKPRTAGVDKFIDEFKREIERIKTSEPESIVLEEAQANCATSGAQLLWEETLEQVTPEQVQIFTRQLANELAVKIAEKITSKIDPEKLLQLIKSELIAHYKKKS
jgi:hypothetical protein